MKEETASSGECVHLSLLPVCIFALSLCQIESTAGGKPSSLPVVGACNVRPADDVLHCFADLLIGWMSVKEPQKRC